MRPALLLTMVWLASGCAGFRAVEHAEWRLVWADPGKRAADAPREVVSRDAYEVEVTEGVGRAWEPPPGFTFPRLHETDAIGLSVGEVSGFVVDEASDAVLEVDGSAVQLYWDEAKKRDTWKDGNDVTVRESLLYVKGKSPGKATLRLKRGPSTKDVPVTVK